MTKPDSNKRSDCSQEVFLRRGAGGDGGGFEAWLLVDTKDYCRGDRASFSMFGRE
ncbi:MAG TPA: hypothetical protein VIQ31_12275 [Phormidium sp.]